MRRSRLNLLFLLCIGSFMIIVFIKIRESSLGNLMLLTDDSKIISLAHVSISALPLNDDHAIESITSSMSLQEIVRFLNDEQKIYNAQTYGPATNETILITIQVHNRITYLRKLIESLRHAQGIDKVSIKKT